MVSKRDKGGRGQEKLIEYRGADKKDTHSAFGLSATQKNEEKTKKYLFYILFTIALLLVNSLHSHYRLIPYEFIKKRESVKVLIQETFLEYINAQNTFIARNYSAIPGNCITIDENKYCDNFRNLYYATDDRGIQIQLIQRSFADAYAAYPRGAITKCNITDGSVPMEELLFSESDSWNPEADYYKLSAFLLFHDEPIKIYEIDSRYPELLLPVFSKFERK